MITQKSTRYFLFWLAWAVLIVYGSLLPFELRPHTLAEAIEKFRNIQFLNLGIVSRADWIANILLYMPLAYLGAMWLSQVRWLPRSMAIIITAILGIALALSVEFTQIFFAPRTVSINDLIAESIGTVLGLIIWSVSHSRLARLTTAIFRPGPGALTAGLTLYALAYFALSMFPYDFILSLPDLQWKLLEGNYGWGFNSCGTLVRCSSQWLAEAAAALPLGMLAVRLLNKPHINYTTRIVIAVGIGISIEAAQFLIASGVSTISGALAKAVGVILGIWLRDPPSPQLAQRHAHWLRPTLLALLVPYLVLAALLNSWADASWGNFEILRNNLEEQRYLPFYYHYFTTETEAVASLIAQAAVYLPLGIGFWLWHASSATPLRRPPLSGLMLTTAAMAFVIESGKLFLPRSHPDPTNILIALSAAWLGLRLCQWLAESVRAPAQLSETKPGAVHLPRKALIASAVVILLLGGLGMVLIKQSADSEVMRVASAQHEYPEAKTLPPVSLPNFRLSHPRLPSPTQQEITQLTQENPKFFDGHRKRAKDGHGKLGSAILMAYVEPGSQDLDALFKQLMALEFTWRGHAEAKNLAQAYDWLYVYWSDAQRQKLRDKLAHGCNYVIEVIRSGRFSPYNMTLYAGPAQALMACSVALYQDDPRGDPVMAFTYDLWKVRILPVWRQVMGNNGGWHEGADKVSKGIGQAIYQLPNLWRHATGEDLFKTEPGIRGFLDFLVYRTRPDGSQIRLGDSSAFKSDAPNRLALALEFNHAAAYSLKSPPKRPVPTSWPWGPLSDNRLYDREAMSALPLTKHFDGIGLVIMRNGWGPESTYITFKAGDNYSSFTHLDQGSFTIYKGGALAIDAGLFYKYGSEHHINYAYQTIAHNVATITDPNEGAATANNQFSRTTRKIANDGGQRRIGGDIEIYPHPLDVDEWNNKRDIYHSGTILHLAEQNDVVTVTADITAAYTNKYSGDGSLSSRNLRVNRYLRTIIYDRINDTLLVYDNIRKSDPGFTSRWLIHFQEQPLLPTSNRFKISLPAYEKLRQPGGVLDGQVLFPKPAFLNAIGGPGKEFWVDGRNYDDNGNVDKHLARGNRKRQTEAGAWRIEVTPPATSATDEFLVALTMNKINQPDLAPLVQCSQESGPTDCVIKGKRETKIQINAEGIVAIQ